MVVAQLTATQLQPLSPEWWMKRLYDRLCVQRDSFMRFDAYYRGVHPLPWLAPQAQDEFRRVLAMARSNYMGLVIDSKAERLQVEGFRVGTDKAADTEMWRIWQANNMDADADMGILEALIGGCSFLMAEPNAKDPSTPRIYVEHPTQAAVEYVPGTNRREVAAGLKVWDDDWTGELHATLYLPDWIYKYKAKRPVVGHVALTLDWKPREVAAETWPAANPMGEVPIDELPNNPRLLTGGVSELADVTDIQDRVNKTLADRLITQDYGAFPQKWAVAWPTEDASGIPNPPINVGRDRMVTSDVKETTFGQWDAAPLDPYSAAKREDVKDIASRTRTPAQYLLGEMSNVNGETLKASESGLISAVKGRQRPYGEGFERNARKVRKLAGLSADGDVRMETIWRDPQYRTEGELVDAAVKKLQSGIASLRQTREDVGYSQEQIRRMEQDDAAVAGADPLALIAGKLAGGAGGSTGVG